MTYDAVVLAGGRASRLAGASKPQLRVAGRRLLDHVLNGITGARHLVVVAPADVPVPAQVRRTLEDPPHGGPVAGIAAGLDALAADGTALADRVLLLSCDTPAAGTALPRLRAALDELPSSGPAGRDGVVLDDGRPQWLIAMLRTPALLAALERLDPVRGCPVHRLMAELDLATVPARGAEAQDVDTWADLHAMRTRLPAAERPAPPAGNRD